MKLIVGRKYLARDRTGKPACYFTLKNQKDARVWYRLIRSNSVTVSPAYNPATDIPQVPHEPQKNDFHQPFFLLYLHLLILGGD